MDAIPLLMEEHQLILRALDALDAFVAGPARTGDGRPELARFVRFIREFADARHHGKEEDILFEAMVAAGFPKDGGPIAVMLMDHGEGRRFVGELRALAEQETPWNGNDQESVVENARGYTDLLRSHIEKEDAILYPMALHRLPPQALERVNADCAAFEKKQVAAGADAVKALGAELVAKYR